MLLAKSLLLVCAAVVVLAQGKYDAVISGGHISGEDTTDPNADGREIYVNTRNYPAAAASILLFSADGAHFNPREKGVIYDSSVYQEYARTIRTFPGFKRLKSYNGNLELNGDRSQFIEAVADSFPTSVNDPQEIAQAFDQLLPRELDENGGRRKAWLLTQTVIHNVKDGVVRVELVEIPVRLSRDGTTGQVSLDKQSTQLSVTLLKLDASFLIPAADRLSERIPQATVAKFVEQLSTFDSQDARGSEVEELMAWLSGSAHQHLYPTEQLRFAEY